MAAPQNYSWPQDTVQVKCADKSESLITSGNIRNNNE